MTRPVKSKKQQSKTTSSRDSLDFRDWIYEPPLIALPEYALARKPWIHLLDQGDEGACTGFGLAAVINYLIRGRGGSRRERVSPRMLYEMAKRHDQWPGHSYDGSTARGAMKGWYKNGVCAEADWPYDVDDPGKLSESARDSALRYPLGSFYRVLPRRSDLHAALAEVDVVFATAATHRGWDDPEDGFIPYDSSWEEEGGHAFAIIGYTAEGLLIQNSWGKDWGGVTFDDGDRYPGCALWSYGDFDRNVWDLWVARLARPFESLEALKGASIGRTEYATGERPARKAPARQLIRDHFVHIDDGLCDPHGDYWSTRPETERVVARAVASGAPHLLVYAHGGLNAVADCAARVAKWRPVMADNGVHEIHVIWETGLLAELRDIVLGKQGVVERRAGGFSDWTDRWIERVTGPLGRGLWREMLSDAEIAFAHDCDGTFVLQKLLAALRGVAPKRRPKLHLVGHSAGSVLLGHLLARWRSLASDGDPVFEDLILFAPACTHEFFKAIIAPAVRAKTIGHLHHFLLDERAERDDNVATIYRKSLLYLVSNSYQAKGEVVPLLGLAEFLDRLPPTPRTTRYTPADNPDRTASTSHGGFDNDPATMNSMLRLVLAGEPRRKFTKEDLSGY